MFTQIAMKVLSGVLLVAIAILGPYSVDSGAWIRAHFSFVKFFGEIRETVNAPPYGYGKTPPVSLGQIKNPENAYIHLKLRFRADSTDGYPNVFQTAPVNRGMRLEISGSTAAIIAPDLSVPGGLKIFILTKTLKTGRWYELEVEALNGAYIRASLDQQSVAYYSEVGLSMEMSEILVGNGFNASRPFRGQIDNISAIKGHTPFLYRSLILVYANLAALITLFICILWIAFGKYGFEDVASPQVDFIEVLAICGWCLYVTLVGVFLSCMLSISKWIPFVLFLLSTLILACRPDSIRKNRYPLGAIVLAAMLAMLMSIVPIFNAYPLPVIALVFLGVGVSIYLLISSFDNNGFSNSSQKCFTSVLICLVGITAWSSLFDLPNWKEYVDSQKISSIKSLLGFVALTTTLVFVYKGRTNSFWFVFPKHTQDKLNRYLPVFHAVVISAFLWMSFRSDALFMGSSIMHWEYYVGPIRTIRGGGWLLWDVPSQYGFLNILLASLVPSASSWQRFYVFQGTLLFIVSSCCYLVAIRFARESLFDKLIAFLIILVGVFFADPTLIGPSLYPSSSVVRFFWCYILILYFLIFPLFNYKQFFVAAVCWAVSVWWSAESAVYTSSILLMAVIARLELGKNMQNKTKMMEALRRYLSIAFSIFGLVSILIFLYYKWQMGIVPDIYSYIEYSLEYARGFGYIQIKWNGPIVFLALMFLGLLLLYVGIYRENKTDETVVPIAGMMGCVWAISSYYVGRAVPNNVTAILPILGVMSYFSILASRKMLLRHYATILKLSALPLIFLLVVPGFTQKFLVTLSRSESFSNDITNQMSNSDGELVKLMLDANITSKTPLTYYGNTGAMPLVSIGGKRFLSENSWLPSPLQLLEKPISSERRLLYLERFIHRNYRAGYLIQQNGNSPDRFKIWVKILNDFYTVDKVYRGKEFTIWHFRPR